VGAVEEEVAEVGDASFAPGRPKVVAVVVEDLEDGRPPCTCS